MKSIPSYSLNVCTGPLALEPQLSVSLHEKPIRKDAVYVWLLDEHNVICKLQYPLYDSSLLVTESCL